MKKSIILLAVSLVVLCLPMHAEHLKFMGIPLTGTITQFQSKLQTKGVKYDKSTSNLLPSGVRVFSGTFAGEKSQIYVYYEPTSKIVYRAKAVIESMSEDICDNNYNEMQSLLSSKYMGAYEETGYQEGHETCLFVISQDVGNDLRDLIGSIGLYVSKNDYSYPFMYCLHIDYIDYENSNKNDSSKMNDL